MKLALSVRAIAERVLLRGTTTTERDRGATVQVKHVTSGVTDLEVSPLYTKRAVVFYGNLYLYITHRALLLKRFTEIIKLRDRLVNLPSLPLCLLYEGRGSVRHEFLIGEVSLDTGKGFLKLLDTSG